MFGERSCTEQYHYWQNMNEGLITFYSTNKPLDKSWHVPGLGYNPSISWDEIRNVAVVHFNGSMKPWLDIAMGRFKSLWTIGNSCYTTKCVFSSQLIYDVMIY